MDENQLPMSQNGTTGYRKKLGRLVTLSGVPDAGLGSWWGAGRAPPSLFLPPNPIRPNWLGCI